VAVHFILVGGHSERAQGAHGGHTVGSGHLISGQRGRGHGGHSPEGLEHLEQSKMTGCCLGMDDLRTYLLRSGTGGHSVLSMYLLRSGCAGHGGMVDLRTYLVISTSLHGGQTTLAISPQLEQVADASNPSAVRFMTNTRAMTRPIRTPTTSIRALSIKRDEPAISTL
jgi:hypothetical protein